MKDQLDRGKSLELEGQDCHAIAGLLKLWLREMPEPLLTYDLYDNWVACASIRLKMLCLTSRRDSRRQSSY